MSRLLATLLIVSALATAVTSAQMTRGRRGAAGPAATTAPADWVRTVDGWERRDMLVVGQRSAPPRLHPGLVAGFLAAASVLALAAFSSPRDR
ncbi:MAG: hypothetical protein CMJ58_26185 [Planctomycetaceae bacterium]|nr:hypothetical protein [Planctomycetaceae bacterium]